MVCALLFVALYLLLPSDGEPGLNRIAPDGIVIVEPGENEQVRPSVTFADPLPYARQSDWPQGQSAQYHFDLQRNLSDSGRIAVFLPSMQAPGRLSVNSVPVAVAVERDFAGPGLGRFDLSGMTKPAAIITGRNRFDLVQFGRGYQVGVGGFYWADSDEGKASIKRVAEARKLLSTIAWASALLGLLAGAAGIAIGHDRLACAAGTLISALTLGGFYPAWVSDDFQMPTAVLAAISALVLASSLLIGWRMRLQDNLAAAFILALTIPSAAGAFIALLGEFTSIVRLDGIFQAFFANAAPLPLMAFGMPLLLLQGMSHQLHLLSKAREEISQRDRIIAEKESELFDEIRRRAVLEERQRLVRDMHDGIGGQLLSLLLKVRSRNIGMGDVEREIRGGITDLRLVVDSLDHVGSDLQSALGSFHDRTRSQLEVAGMQLGWEQSSDIEDYHLAARKTLSLYRFMQEAVANSVRHSAADRLDFKIESDPPSGSLRIAIADNGTGFDPAQANGGKGLSNMRQRAASLGAQLTIESSDDGTVITLVLPVSKEPKDSASHSEPPRK